MDASLCRLFLGHRLGGRLVLVDVHGNVLRGWICGFGGFTRFGYLEELLGQSLQPLIFNRFMDSIATLYTVCLCPAGSCRLRHGVFFAIRVGLEWSRTLSFVGRILFLLTSVLT